MTLCLLLEGDNILLGMKKRGFGAGRWNSFGGKVKPEETLEEAVFREFEEESTLKVLKYEKVGIMEFEFKDSLEVHEVHIYKILKYCGTPRETEEMRTQWFKVSEIPYDKMWPGDEYWMKILLEGKKFRGKTYFENQDKIIDYNIQEVCDF